MKRLFLIVFVVTIPLLASCGYPNKPVTIDTISKNDVGITLKCIPGRDGMSLIYCETVHEKKMGVISQHHCKSLGKNALLKIQKGGMYQIDTTYECR